MATVLTEMTAGSRNLTAEGMLVGTFQYMSPEQLEGKDADVRSDIFAFGTVIYEMTTGRPAFVGKSKASLIAAILSFEPPSIAELQPMTPPQLARVVRICLAKNPDDRWQTAHDLKIELQGIAEGGSQAAVPVGKELFYITPDHKLVAAEVIPKGTNLEIGRVQPLFDTPPLAFPGSPYDVSKDGRRFLVNSSHQQRNLDPITLVTNWTTEVKH